MPFSFISCLVFSHETADALSLNFSPPATRALKPLAVHKLQLEFFVAFTCTKRIKDPIFISLCRTSSGAKPKLRGTPAAWAAAATLYSQLGEDNLMEVAFALHVAKCGNFLDFNPFLPSQLFFYSQLGKDDLIEFAFLCALHVAKSYFLLSCASFLVTHSPPLAAAIRRRRYLGGAYPLNHR